jgi:hypothetical protein
METARKILPFIDGQAEDYWHEREHTKAPEE